jgi:hypothetical protein
MIVDSYQLLVGFGNYNMHCLHTKNYNNMLLKLFPRGN